MTSTEIPYARRILCLNQPGCQSSKLVQALTGSIASNTDIDSTSDAGHCLRIETAYYSATVPIWQDQLANSTEWQCEFSQPEAKQVVDAIGAWIFCFTNDTPTCHEQLDAGLQAIQAVIDLHADGRNDAVMLAVALPHTDGTVMTEDRFTQLEDITMRYNFELVDYAATGSNDFGEKQGLDRIREALEANEWTSFIEGGEDDDLNALDSLGSGETEIDADLSDLKTALVDKDPSITSNDEIEGEEQAGAVDDLEVMLSKLLAVKEQSSDLPLAQRKRVAAQAVREVMHTR